ncbi:MAG: alpha-L-rhamnosidase C-terminal domain-containing protein, partial [Gemmatimonadota bacterium]|nr:alpha-L-rhamnosidase C-terminal domain-containing protein [Gemmatimonadota bacterium]
PWEASWISCPDRDGTSYGVFHFRKTFRLEEKPEEFIIHVSADNRYKLYVNGAESADGPARGDLLHWRFETVDIAGYLVPGENLLAAVVWNFDEYVPWAQMTHETAFLVQGNTGRESVINTDETWKVVENKAYSPIPLDWDKLQDFVVVGAGDRVDGRLFPWGWQEPGFEDSRWLEAVPVSRVTPRGMRDADTHWYLVPRMIPPLEKKVQPASEVRRASGIEVEEVVFKVGNRVIVPARSKATLLLDQTYLTTAYPEFLLSRGKDARIELTYAEALKDAQGNKGQRDEIQGKSILGYSDEFTADGGSNRLFTTLWFRTFRYIELDIETAGEPLTIERFSSRFVGYPFQEVASFGSDDRSLDDIWKVAWRTARLCAGETYFDCPYYEQLNYVGDTRIQSLISLYVSGDDRLMRKALVQFDDSRIPDGLTQSRYPSYAPQIIPPYSLFWIAMVHDYWMHRQDPEFVRGLLPGVRSVLGWFERHLTGNDMLGDLPWWNFVDWVPEYPKGVCPGAEDGETSVISLQFVYALEYAAELFESFGREHEAEHARRISSRVKAAVREHCWSGDRGMFAETPEKKQFSQHANSMAILVDLLPPGQARALFEKTVSEKDLIQCTFYYRFYLLRALKKVGLGDRYLEMLEPWHDMLRMGLTTFSETPEPTRSDCHAWSSSPMLDLLATVAGIEPSAQGFRKVRIEPHLGKLKWIEAVVPHPAGRIECSLKRRGKKGVSGQITLPEGLSGVFLWRGKEVFLHPGTQQVDLD